MGVHRVELLASAARTASGTGGVFDLAGTIGGGSQYSAGLFLLDVSAVSGTVPTLDCFVQTEMPDGSFSDAVAFGQLLVVTRRQAVLIPGNTLVESPVPDASLTVSSVKGVPLGGKWRVKWTIGGVTPSFTFKVLADFYD